MLSPDTLAGYLMPMLSQPQIVKSAQDAQNKWTSAYTRYASTATDVSTDMVASVNPTGFKSALAFNRSRDAKSISDFCSQMDMAFVNFWTGATFAIGIPPSPAAACASVGGNGIFGLEISSTVISVLPGVMAGKLLPILSELGSSESPASKADKIAKAMHDATTSAVLVLITGTDTTPSPAGPLPITNTCRIS